MPTERGWIAFGVAAALALLWLGLGEVELFTTGLLLLGALLFGLVFVRLNKPTVTVTRQLTPSTVREGDLAMVETRIVTSSRVGLWNPTVEDHVVGLGSATFVTAKITQRNPGVASYQILCRPRGRFEVGPARVWTTDPLRLVRLGGAVGDQDVLVVYPSIEPLSGFPTSQGRDPSTQASRPEFSQSGGEDFFTIREYETGDDLRRVHWPSSAKRDRLMIRQLETPWQSRALVMLDTRNTSYPNSALFEQAVRGAASVIHHLHHRGFDAELWIGDRPLQRKANHYIAAMEMLADVDLVKRFDLAEAAGRIQRAGRGGALIFVGGEPDSGLLAAHRVLSASYRTAILMSATDTKNDIDAMFRQAGVTIIRAGTNEKWAPGWLASVDKPWSSVSAS